MGTSRIARLDSKHEHIRQTLLDMSTGAETPQSGGRLGSITCPGLLLHSPTSKPPRRKRIGRLQMNGQPKLFGGSLEEYLESLNQDIPLIIKSCIRVINLYGKCFCKFIIYVYKNVSICDKLNQKIVKINLYTKFSENQML